MVRLLSTKKFRSPLNGDDVRLEGVVSYGDNGTQNIWFDVPSKYSDYISERGELWAILLLPCAMVLGEDVQIDLPVDPLLLENLNGVQKIWAGWYRWVNQVEVGAIEAVDTRPMRNGSGICFSGGIDSYYSLIRLNKTIGNANEAPSYLLTLWGFDIRLNKPRDFEGVKALGQECAERFNSNLIPITTNLRELIGYQWQFDLMSHSAALASVGHLLSNQISNVVIGSTHEISELIPWGSHPLVDPLFSSAETRIVHDGATVNRVDKTEAICHVPAALSALRVCNRSRSRENCSKCSKCLRTMVTIDLCGQQGGARSFDWSAYSLDRVAGTYLSNMNEINFAREIMDAASERGREDIEQAVQRSILRSKLMRPLDWGLSKLVSVPYFWRYEKTLRRSIFGIY